MQQHSNPKRERDEVVLKENRGGAVNSSGIASEK